MEYFGLYVEFIKIKFNKSYIYRSAYLWTSLAKILIWSTEFLLIWILINKFQDINGWSAYEVMFLFAINTTSYALAGFFFFGVSFSIPGLIRSGAFDEILTRPLNGFIYLVCREFHTSFFTHMSVSVTMLVVCFAKLGITLTPSKIVFLIIILISSSLIQGAAFIISSVPSFWMVQSDSLRRIVSDLRGFVRYPLSVYNNIIQIILTFILPYGFISFYPSQYFLGKDDFVMFNPIIQYLSPIVGIVAFTLAYRFWNLGIKHYKSTGS